MLSSSPRCNYFSSVPRIFLVLLFSVFFVILTSSSCNNFFVSSTTTTSSSTTTSSTTTTSTSTQTSTTTTSSASTTTTTSTSGGTTTSSATTTSGTTSTTSNGTTTTSGLATSSGTTTTTATTIMPTSTAPAGPTPAPFTAGPTPAPPTTPSPPTTTQPPTITTQNPQATPAPPATTPSPTQNYNVVAVYIDILLFATDASLFDGTTQEVWTFFSIFCKSFLAVPGNEFWCKPVANPNDPFIGLNPQNPTLKRPLVAARRFLSGQYLVPHSNNTFLMTLRFKGAHDVVAALFAMMNSGSHVKSLGIISAHAMPALDTIYNIGGGDSVRIGSYDTQLSVTWHLIISVGTILAASSLYILRVRTHPEEASYVSSAADASTGAGNTFDDLNNPNEHKRWLPTQTEEHREKLLDRVWKNEENARVLVGDGKSVFYTDTEMTTNSHLLPQYQNQQQKSQALRGDRLLANLNFGNPLIAEEMRRNMELIDGALELSPQLKLPPPKDSPAYKRMRLMKRKRFVVLVKNENGEEVDPDADDFGNMMGSGGSAGAGGRKKKIVKQPDGTYKEVDDVVDDDDEEVIPKELTAKEKADSAVLRSDLTAVAPGVRSFMDQNALGLARRRMAASLTTYAECSTDGRAMPHYKNVEVSMSSVSPLSQLREHRKHLPEVTWAELRRVQEEYGKELLAGQARRAGMPEPTDEQLRKYEDALRDIHLEVREIEEEVDDEDYSPGNGDEDDDDDDVVAPPINPDEL